MQIIGWSVCYYLISGAKGLGEPLRLFGFTNKIYYCKTIGILEVVQLNICASQAVNATTDKVRMLSYLLPKGFVHSVHLEVDTHFPFMQDNYKEMFKLIFLA